MKKRLINMVLGCTVLFSLCGCGTGINGVGGFEGSEGGFEGSEGGYYPGGTSQSGQTGTTGNSSTQAGAGLLVHNQGRNCLSCHSNRFGAAGTIFTKKNAQDGDAASAASSAYTIELVSDKGTKIRFAKAWNGTGNRYAYPTAVQNIAYFTPQVVNTATGQVVNRSRYQHDANRFACNRCHTATGANGAPGRVVNYNYYNQQL